MGALISSQVFQPPPYTRMFNSTSEGTIHTIDVPSGGLQIPLLFLSATRSPEKQPTLLFAHGNAEDLAHVKSFAAYVVNYTNVNFAAFEYPGYGSSGWLDKAISEPLLPTEERVYAAAEAAFDWLTRNVSSSTVILFGRSLGSGAAVHLAVRAARTNVAIGGLILQSPLASVVRVRFPQMCMTIPYVDMFANIDKIGSINCRTTIIHGNKDGVVPVQCAHQLYDAIPDRHRATPLFIENAHHNDIEQHQPVWLNHLMQFVNACAPNAI